VSEIRFKPSIITIRSTPADILYLLSPKRSYSEAFATSSGSIKVRPYNTSEHNVTTFSRPLPKGAV